MKDLIDRQALIKEFSDFVRASNNSDFTPMPTWNDAVSLVKSMPPVQPERIRGHWVNGRCDKCNEHAPFWAMASTYYESNFCPNCGADMRGEQDG